MFKALNHVIIEKADVKQALSIRLIFNKRDLHMFKALSIRLISDQITHTHTHTHTHTRSFKGLHTHLRALAESKLRPAVGLSVVS